MSGRIRRPVIVLALCVAALMASTATGYALWQATATASGTVTVASLPTAPAVTCDDTATPMKLSWTTSAPYVEVEKDDQNITELEASAGPFTTSASGLGAGTYSFAASMGAAGWVSAATSVTVTVDAAKPSGLRCGP